MNYHDLRRQGIRHLERMAGTEWTDFNPHDPGITILEQVCYALTDLDYRIGFEIEDLLAEGGADPYQSLYPPPEILSSRPVTLEDLRRLVLDVEGVRNAWIEPAVRGSESRPDGSARAQLTYDAEAKTLAFGQISPVAASVRLAGLHRVLIETVDHPGLEPSRVRRSVARRLHAHRSLGEDFATIQVLEKQGVQVTARLEITALDDTESLLLEVFASLAQSISPPLPFLSLEQRLEAGIPVDEIFEGPLLAKGFLEPDEAGQAGTQARPGAVHTSDLIHALMDVPGVRAVKQIRLSAGGDSEPWTLTLDSGRVPALDLEGSEILLERNGIVVQVDRARALAAYHAQLRAQASSDQPDDETEHGDQGPLAPPAGSDRQVRHYDAVQGQFPEVYGIGDLGLPASASPRRQAQARQLKAYLLFFDQLLADDFAQLAHVKDLFSFYGDDLRTYFTQRVDGPGLAEIRGSNDVEHLARLEQLALGPDGGEISLERKNRFLSHLLARFAEQLIDYAPSDATRSAAPASQQLEQLARSKQDFLQHYPRISSARGTAFDLLHPVSVSGLEERLRRELSRVVDLEGTIFLVEHILLRPVEADEAEGLFLEQVPHRDPFSLQLSLVLPETLRRFEEIIRQTARRQTPAHLTLFVHWFDAIGWSQFQQEMRSWLELQEQHRAQQLGLGEQVSETDRAQLATEVRVVRNRLIELLGLGRPPFLIGLEVEVESQIIPFDTGATILVPDSQPGVEYTLCYRDLKDDEFIYEVAGRPRDAEGQIVARRELLRVPVPGETDVLVRLPEAFEEMTEVAPRPGTGGPLSWTIEHRLEDTLFYVKAQRAGGTDDELEATQRLRAVVVLVEPNAEVALAARLEEQSGHPGVLLRHGQPGVWYQFQNLDGTALGPPLTNQGYFYQRQGQENRGLDDLRLEIDFFVSRGYDLDQGGQGYAEYWPEPPFLEVGTLDPGLDVKVWAVKARTRVGTFLRSPGASPPAAPETSFRTPPHVYAQDTSIQAPGSTKIEFIGRDGETYALFVGEVLQHKQNGKPKIKGGNGQKQTLGTGELSETTTFDLHVYLDQDRGLRWIVPVTVEVEPPSGGSA